MLRKLILLIPFLLLAFSSSFTPHLNQYFKDLKCDVTLHKKAFDICYSCKYKHPLAVAYMLQGDLVKKKLKRKGLRFRPDYNLPIKCRAYTKDYSKTGFDRGHLAPNAAFDYSKSVQKQTFLLSNIAPQKPQLNRKLWNKIERLSRFLAVKYKKVEVITGTCGSIGKIKNNVNIPRWWYKIIYIPSLKKSVAFLAPNTNSKMSKAKIKQFKTTINTIKQTCGF